MRIVIGVITILLVLQVCFTYAKVIKKVKHVGHHHHKAKRAMEAFDLKDKDECIDHSYCIKYSHLDCAASFVKNNCKSLCGHCAFDLTNKDDCTDHTYCIKYSQLDCATFFVKTNCKSLCGLCGQRKMIKLPMVVYYNKHKAAAKKHVVRRAANPTYPPTTTQTLFDYVGGYNKWNFQFTDKHPIQMDWSKPQPPLKPADQTSNQADTQNSQQAAAAAPAADQSSYQAAPAQNDNVASSSSAQTASAYPAAQNAFQPQAASPEQNTYQNQQPVAAASTGTQANDDTTTIKLPNSALERANQGKDVYVALVDEKKQNKPSYTLTSAQNDAPKKQDDNPIQSFNYAPVKVPCPPGQECNYKGPNAPQVNQTFMVYCDDRFPSCGVLHSSCNDSWLQLYCPKRCNLCRPEDQPMQLNSTQQDASITNDQQQQQTQFGNKVYPTKITELKDESPKMESELVAPEPGQKAERAKYTLHVVPKLKDGIPQTQEILIMPPNASPGSDVKPLVILKQRVTKPMIENIEIDVPPKGTKYSDEPKVEVIEGNRHESLNVVGGQADLSQAEAELQADKTQQSQDATPTQTTPAETTAANATAQGNYNWTTTPAPAAAAAAAAAVPAQQPAAQTQETQPAQNTQSQYSQTQTYQDTQNQATQSQAAQPAQSYQDTQAQASQTQAAQPEATQTQATQDQAQSQSAQPQATQSYAAATPAPTSAPATAQAAAYPAQQTYTAAQACSDDAICASYTDTMCNQTWLQNHCKSKCKLC